MRDNMRLGMAETHTQWWDNQPMVNWLSRFSRFFFSGDVRESTSTVTMSTTRFKKNLEGSRSQSFLHLGRSWQWMVVEWNLGPGLLPDVLHISIHFLFCISMLADVANVAPQKTRNRFLFGHGHWLWPCKVQTAPLCRTYRGCGAAC